MTYPQSISSKMICLIKSESSTGRNDSSTDNMAILFSEQRDLWLEVTVL